MGDRISNMKNVIEYLERTASKFPGKTAVVDEYESCTYEELLAYSQKVGSYLGSKIKAGQPVPVLMEKSINALCAFMGAAQVGCFYVLMNPDLPMTRLKQIQQVVKAPYVITDTDHKELAAEIFDSEQILLIEQLKKSPVDRELLEIRKNNIIDTDPLYANFTSGSTGVPKGVLVGHRSVIDFIDVFTKTFSITDNDIVGNQAPFDFDVSVKDIYSAFSTGATLVVVPKRLFSRPAELLDFICEHDITTMIWAVSALCLISTFHGLDYKVPEKVNKILFSGEVMPMKHLNNWMQHLPETEFVNLYGPTEITCNCTYHRIDRNKEYEAGIPIGKAFDNERVILIDDNGNAVTAVDETGEICVSGTALALGYYGDLKQTQERFTQNPLNNNYYERIYRTGDLGKYNEDGEIVFQGRKDFQIKYMGHRIELEEIEKAMMSVPGIERGCCVFDENKSKLYGFYIGNIDKKELHGILSQSLPVFMIPGLLVQVEDMPLTKNGKIDRKALVAQSGRKKHE